MEVAALVTFAPARGAFRAHPLRVMRQQAKALGIPHRIVRLDPPYRLGYRRAFQKLGPRGIDTLVTGDLDRVGGRPNWIRSIAEPLGFRVLTPLWHRSRARILRQLQTSGFEIVFSYVRASSLGPEWVGRCLDARAENALHDAHRIRRVDLCGENGEYHTWVLDAPLFRSRLRLTGLSTREGRGGRWLHCRRVELVSKPRA